MYNKYLVLQNYNQFLFYFHGIVSLLNFTRTVFYSQNILKVQFNPFQKLLIIFPYLVTSSLSYRIYLKLVNRNFRLLCEVFNVVNPYHFPTFTNLLRNFVLNFCTYNRKSSVTSASRYVMCRPPEN